MRRRTAALETVPRSATVTKVRTCRRSMPILMPARYRKQDKSSIGRLSPVTSLLIREFRCDRDTNNIRHGDSHESALFDAAGRRWAGIGNDASPCRDMADEIVASHRP